MSLHRRTRQALLAGLVLLAAGGSPAAAQEQERPVEVPYEPQLLRISEILGALHYLRPLCGHEEEQVWRDQMQALVDAENPDLQRRARMVDRFNRGHDSFRSVYRSCTQAAELVVENYLQEGARIAREITARYGTGAAVSPAEALPNPDSEPDG